MSQVSHATTAGSPKINIFPPVRHGQPGIWFVSSPCSYCAPQEIVVLTLTNFQLATRSGSTAPTQSLLPSSSDPSRAHNPLSLALQNDQTLSVPMRNYHLRAFFWVWCLVTGSARHPLLFLLSNYTYVILLYVESPHQYSFSISLHATHRRRTLQRAHTPLRGSTAIAPKPGKYPGGLPPCVPSPWDANPRSAAMAIPRSIYHQLN